MIKINNKERVIEEINENMVENTFNIILNLSDKVLDYNEENYNISELIDSKFEDKRKYKSNISSSLLVLSGVQSRMKQHFSISELPLALTSKKIIEKINVNIAYDEKDSLLKESNIRSWLDKYKETENDKIVFNNYFIKYFNQFNKLYLEKTEIKSNIHTLDCSILSVNLDNSNYEGSSTTYKGGERLRGYKISVLRGMTPNSGVIEEICMSTAKTHDLTMSKDMVLNSDYLKSDDYLLMDRGFLDIAIKWTYIPGATEYKIYYTDNLYQPSYSLLGTSDKTYYVLENAVIGKTYCFKVVACSSAGNSDYSDVFSGAI